jgi:hypothetical protein
MKQVEQDSEEAGERGKAGSVQGEMKEKRRMRSIKLVLTSLIPGRDGRGHSHRHSNRQVWTLTPI